MENDPIGKVQQDQMGNSNIKEFQLEGHLYAEK